MEYLDIPDFIECLNYYEASKKENASVDLADISLYSLEHVDRLFGKDEKALIIIDGFMNIDPINRDLMARLTEQYPLVDVYAHVPYDDTVDNQFVEGEVLKDFIGMGFERIEDSAEMLIAPVDVAIRNSPCIDHEVRIMAKTIKDLVIEYHHPLDRRMTY